MYWKKTLLILSLILAGQAFSRGQPSGQILYRSGDPELYQTANDERAATRRQLQREEARVQKKIKGDEKAIEEAKNQVDESALKKYQAQLQEDKKKLKKLKKESKSKERSMISF